MASCRILSKLGYKNPFQRTKHDQVCFNGEFQHNYLLDHVLSWHKHSSRPTFAYTALNVPHDSFGRRTQSLNLGLLNHARKALKTGNTLTILLADHGNTYTSYVRQTVEGRFEMFHPSFFMIVPDSVAKILGDDTMDSLRANQRRLFTMIDVNAGLRAIAALASDGKMPKRRGIFGLIPAERICSDLPLRLPNLCVCEGWDNSVKNDTLQVHLLEFAVGTLNNRINRQRQVGWQSTTTSSQGKDKFHRHRCNHLVPLHFTKLRERRQGKSIIASFDFAVSAGQGAAQLEDVFHVEVKSNIGPNLRHAYIEMLSFDRLSPFEPYKKCTDEGVDAQLCVCSMREDDKARNGVSYTAMKSVKAVLNYMPYIKGIPSRKILYNRKTDRCIYLITRSYYSRDGEGKPDEKRVQAAAIEAMNVCLNEPFEVRIQLELQSMKSSGNITFSVVLLGDTITSLSTLVTESASWYSSYKFIYSLSPLR